MIAIRLALVFILLSGLLGVSLGLLLGPDRIVENQAHEIRRVARISDDIGKTSLHSNSTFAPPPAVNEHTVDREPHFAHKLSRYSSVRIVPIDASGRLTPEICEILELNPSEEEALNSAITEALNKIATAKRNAISLVKSDDTSQRFRIASISSQAELIWNEWNARINSILAPSQASYFSESVKFKSVQPIHQVSKNFEELEFTPLPDGGFRTVRETYGEDGFLVGQLEGNAKDLPIDLRAILDVSEE